MIQIRQLPIRRLTADCTPGLIDVVATWGVKSICTFLLAFIALGPTADAMVFVIGAIHR
jgi:hypothetical protein